MSRPRQVVAFRADASIEIGTGHVMRCLALADALSAAGASCHFICRDLPGNLAAHVRDQGHGCHLLDAPGERFDDALTEHSRWLGVATARDAEDTRDVLRALRPDWLIVDHYALEARWEREVLIEGTRLFVIDDLADRPHRADVLLDQNLGRAAEDYDGLVPPGCRRLIGPRYALLRPEFAALREESLNRRKDGDLQHILVSMGGIDAGNATAGALEGLCAASLPSGCRITVVMGRSAPWIDEIQRRSKDMPVPTQVLVGVRNMAELMASADLAIGAAGSTSWERCCLGVPTIIVVLADNQARAAEALVASGAAIALKDVGRLGADLAVALETFSDPEALVACSRRARDVADGHGVHRCLREIGGLWS